MKIQKQSKKMPKEINLYIKMVRKLQLKLMKMELLIIQMKKDREKQFKIDNREDLF